MDEIKMQDKMSILLEACHEEVTVGGVGTSGQELFLMQAIAALKKANPDASDHVLNYWFTEAMA
jgi:hypothetical protein